MGAMPGGLTIGNRASVTKRKPWTNGHVATVLSKSTVTLSHAAGYSPFRDRLARETVDRKLEGLYVVSLRESHRIHEALIRQHLDAKPPSGAKMRDLHSSIEARSARAV